jgi:hypothetical protein
MSTEETEMEADATLELTFIYGNVHLYKNQSNYFLKGEGTILVFYIGGSVLNYSVPNIGYCA